jgi:hypothetical protein
MHLYKLIVPMGLIAFVFLLATGFAGAMKVNVKTHKLLAAIAIIAAVLHVGIIFYIKFTR